MASALRSELSLLRALTSNVNAGMTVNELLTHFSEEIRRFVPFDRLEYSAVEAEDPRYVRTEWISEDHTDGDLAVGHRFRRDESVSRTEDYRYAVLNADLPAYAADKSPDHPVAILARHGYNSSIACPLTTGSRVTGFIFLNAFEPNTYTDRHTELIQQVAAVLSFALEQTRLNDELARRADALEQVAKARSEFIASISHELRTPLTAVLGFSVALRDQLESLAADEVREFALAIADQCADAAAIVEDLLVASRAEFGELTIRLDEIDILDLVHKVNNSSSAYGEITVATPPEPIRPVVADELRLRQILRNLFSNAIRYGGNTVTVAFRTESETVIVDVTDDGPGVPVTDRDAIFESFTTSQQSPTRPGSIGLGLSVSRTLAAAMGGSIHYHLVDDESVFSLHLRCGD